MKKKLLSAVLCLSLVASLAACGGKSNEPKEDASASQQQTDTSEAQEPTGPFELHVAISANPPALDPPIANSNIVGGIGVHIYEGLFMMNEKYEPVPILAEDYEVSDDGLEYTIKLRQGVMFHNGKEMKAEDVVASMDYWLAHSAKASTLIGGSTFEKVDDYTVKMVANKAASDIILILASPIQFAAIYPEEVVASAEEAGITEFIGTGAYKFAEWKQDQYVKLERNEEYQPAPNASAGGIAGTKNAYADVIYFDVVTDSATRVAGVQSGQYQVAEDVPSENYGQLSSDPSLELNVYEGGTLNLFLNTTKGVMANLDMRQAILAALNCDDILLASFGEPDLYKLNSGWMNPADAQWGTDAGKEYYNQNDQAKAEDLLKKAGYNGETVTLVTTGDYPEMYNATIVVQEQLKQVGINAEVESTDFSTFMEHRSNPDTFDMFITSNSYNMIPIQLSVLDKGWAGLDAPEVAEKISLIRDAATPADASLEWQALQSFLYEYGAATVLGHYTGIQANNVDVTGTEYLRFNLYWNVKPVK